MITAKVFITWRIFETLAEIYAVFNQHTAVLPPMVLIYTGIRAIANRAAQVWKIRIFTEYYGERYDCVSTAGWHVKHKPGFAVKGGAGQVQGEPCRGSKGAQPFAGRDRAKTCEVIKDRAGAAEKVPQDRPHIIE